MQDSTDDSDFVDADVALHLRIASATGNSVLSNMLGSIASLLNVWRRNVVEAAESTEPSYREHVPIYEAIAASDPDAASEAMRKHMDGAACRLNAAIAAHSSDNAAIADR